MIVDPEKLGTRCLQLAALCAMGATVFFWGSWILIIIAWCGVIPLALFFGLITGFVGAAIGARVEKARVWTEDTKIVITARSEAVFGTFRDMPIHEWVDLQRPDNGETIRLEYLCTVPDSKNFTPPLKVWFALLSPGILYAEPESAETAGSTPA